MRGLALILSNCFPSRFTDMGVKLHSDGGYPDEHSEASDGKLAEFSSGRDLLGFTTNN
jgi:hypothetical protein